LEPSTPEAIVLAHHHWRGVISGRRRSIEKEEMRGSQFETFEEEKNLALSS